MNIHSRYLRINRPARRRRCHPECCCEFFCLTLPSQSHHQLRPSPQMGRQGVRDWVFSRFVAPSYYSYAAVYQKWLVCYHSLLVALELGPPLHLALRLELLLHSHSCPLPPVHPLHRRHGSYHGG